MKSQIEINRLSIGINSNPVNSNQKAVILSQGQLPIVDVPYKLGLVNMHWEVFAANQLPEMFNLILAGEVVSPDWKFQAKPVISAHINWTNKIVQWENEWPFEIKELKLEEKSQFYIDGHEVHLTNTIGSLLDHLMSAIGDLDYGRINLQLSALSETVFGSSFLTDLLHGLFYRINGSFEKEHGKMWFTASYDHTHFAQNDNAPPYLFFQIPTEDLEYLFHNTDLALLEVKGYKIHVKKIKVINGNKLRINIIEVNKNWDILVDASLELRNNILNPVVETITVEGLDLLTKALFSLFKGLLIRQIEKKTINIHNFYQNFKSDFEARYPFIELMPGYSPVVDSLKLNTGITEIMMHFLEEQEWQVDHELT